MARLMAKKVSFLFSPVPLRILAEGEGFEPSIRNFRMPPFQGGTFNHSATLPRWSELTVASESAIVQYIFKVV